MGKDEDYRDASAAVRVGLDAICQALDRPRPRISAGIAQPEDEGAPVLLPDPKATPLETVEMLLAGVSSQVEEFKKIGSTAGPLLIQRVDALIERIREQYHHPPTTRIQAGLDLVPAAYGGEGAFTVNIDSRCDVQFWHTKGLSPGRGVALGVAAIAFLGVFLEEQGNPMGAFIVERIKTFQAEVVERAKMPPDDGKPD